MNELEKKEENYLPAVKMVGDIVDAVSNFQVYRLGDIEFLREHSQHLATVFEKSYMWRTQIQKKSIISDIYHPTLHSKFAQAILEQRVQTEQSFYLAKDFEMKKLEIAELQCDLEDLIPSDGTEMSQRNSVKAKKFQIEIQFKQYELKNIQITMKWRMSEIIGWQKILDELLIIMRESGMSEEEIWNKDEGEIIDMFYLTLNNLQGLKSSSDGAEHNNLIALAMFAYNEVKALNLLGSLVAKCTPLQLEGIKFLEGIQQSNSKL